MWKVFVLLFNPTRKKGILNQTMTVLRLAYELITQTMYFVLDNVLSLIQVGVLDLKNDVCELFFGLRMTKVAWTRYSWCNRKRVRTYVGRINVYERSSVLFKKPPPDNRHYTLHCKSRPSFPQHLMIKQFARWVVCEYHWLHPECLYCKQDLSYLLCQEQRGGR